MTNALSILQHLTKPGLTLVFCDDTNVSHPPADALVSDLRILCAVVISSEAYAHVQTAMAQKLQGLEAGVPEFHATEIVNPKTGSAWKQVPIGKRLDALTFLGELLTKSATKLYYIYVSEAQYEQLKDQAEQQGTVSVNHHAGLKRVFLRCLFERLEAAGRKTLVVLDQNKPLAAPTIEILPEGAFLVGGGPIVADSASVAGLQLADMAAFSIGRYWQKKATLKQGAGKPFDEVALATIAEFEGRCELLLNPATAKAD